jgi:RNA polymerase sigma factor (sigma-70 family)
VATSEAGIRSRVETDQLNTEQLRKIRHGLRGSLRARNFDESSIDRYAEDAIANGLIEFTKAQRCGKEIPDPIAWIIKVSIWRSIDLLRQDERRRAEPFSEEDELEIASRPETSLDEVVLDNIEAVSLRQAVEALPKDQREALRSYYFWELSTRAGAKHLHWSEATFRRRLKAAMHSLRDRFGVPEPEQGDRFGIEVGLAASMSLSGAAHVAAGLGDQVAPATEVVESVVSQVLKRAKALFDRVIPGAGSSGEHSIDPVAMGRAVEAASGPSGAAAGKLLGAGCAGAAVLICAATGVVGPGVGGLFHSSHDVRAHRSSQQRVTLPSRSGPVRRHAPRQTAKPSRSVPARQKTRPTASASSSKRRVLGDESGSRAERTHASTEALGVESAATSPSAPAPVAPAPPPESSEPASNPTRESSEQFAP